ncbi:MAG: class I SAM-dependent methyltransferase [Acidimicrobiales bacterium]
MRPGRPSLTARGVAVARAGVERPRSPMADLDGEHRLEQGLARWFWLPSGPLRRYLGVRTRFFDERVLDAISSGTDQVVIIGAGYDTRALRFRSPGVRFFEVDHPATQVDKRRRRAACSSSTSESGPTTGNHPVYGGSTG